MAKRQANIVRNTKETEVEVTIMLEGTGTSEVSTGIGFLDHMLQQFSCHSMVDLTIRAKGDTQVDCHHATEDVGIALGQALKLALGEKMGVNRFADVHLAMDETLTRCVVDVSGRPCLVWQVEFPTQKVGEFDTELFREFFQAFAMNSGITLHLANLYGANSHHIAESCFKALARCVRGAVKIDPQRPYEIPTTKGRLGN